MFVVSPSDKGPRKLPCAQPLRGRCYDGSPAFSPGGRLLATGTLGTEREQVAIRRLRGQVRRRFFQPFGVSDLAWGGTARQLAIAIDGYERIRLLSPMSGDTSVFRRRDGHEIAQSPQGRLAWTSDYRTGLWVTDRTRSQVRRLPLRASAPDWSPDGRQLVFKDPSGRAVLINADGSGRRHVPGAAEPTITTAGSPGHRMAGGWRAAPPTEI